MNHDLYLDNILDNMALKMQIEDINKRLSILEKLIERTTILENELRGLKAKQLNIEVGKFYEFKGEKVFIESEFSKPLRAVGFNNIFHTLPLFNILKSNGEINYLSEEDLVLLKPWDFKGKQPTVCPEVDKWYKTRLGAVIYFKKKCNEKGVFLSNTGFVYDSHGCPYTLPYSLTLNDLIEEVPKPKEELALEVGGYYENEEGKIKKIILKNNSGFICFKDEDGTAYCKNGKSYIHLRSDLIKKVPAPISLEVDSFWKTNNGSKIYIYWIEGDTANGLVVGKLHGSYAFSLNGKAYNGCSEFDIVAKWGGRDG